MTDVLPWFVTVAAVPWARATSDRIGLLMSVLLDLVSGHGPILTYIVVVSVAH